MSDGCQIIKGDINIAEAFATYFKSTFTPSSLTGKFTDPGTCLSSLALVIDKIFEGDETCMNMKREAETTTVLGDTESYDSFGGPHTKRPTRQRHDVTTTVPEDTRLTHSLDIRRLLSSDLHHQRDSSKPFRGGLPLACLIPAYFWCFFAISKISPLT
ncbi:hypothetical protein J6590_083435 [Homalodisca vitripennis]|nr:hypothetical protein J6590_083435 [Homalodisca vitripennis]